MFYFETRKLAREFAKNTGKKPVDNGTTEKFGRRWAVSIF